MPTFLVGDAECRFPPDAPSGDGYFPSTSVPFRRRRPATASAAAPATNVAGFSQLPLAPAADPMPVRGKVELLELLPLELLPLELLPLLDEPPEVVPPELVPPEVVPPVVPPVPSSSP